MAALSLLAAGFQPSEKEQQIFAEWFDEHQKTCRHFQEPVRMQFLPTSPLTFSFTPSSAATFCKVNCLCGETKDITDYDGI